MTNKLHHQFKVPSYKMVDQEDAEVLEGVEVEEDVVEVSFQP